MARFIPEWGTAITNLLKKHNLTFRAAAIKAGMKVSHTTIRDWGSGIAPEVYNANKAYDFLSAFTKDEMLECLNAAGLPPPPEYMEDKDLLSRVRIALNGADEISDFSKQMIIDIIKREMESEKE